MTPLSSTDVRRLSRSQRVVLTPLAYPTLDAWMHAVKDEIRGLFSAEQAYFLLLLPTGPLIASSLDPKVQAAYFEEFARIDVAGAMLEASPLPYAVEEDAAGLPMYPDYAASAAFNEWYRPNRMDRSVSLRTYDRPVVATGFTRGWSNDLVANVLLGGSPAARGERAGAARTMLALLQPALAAAVGAVQQAHSGGPAGFGSPHVSAILDGLEAPAWLFDEAGRCVHQSAAASRLSGRLPEGDVLRAAAEMLARALLRGARLGAAVPSAWGLEMGGERVGLSGTYLRAGGASAPAVLVRAERAPPALPSEEVIRTRFGLTPQEARVALLRARGEATAAIAERLSVSVHTVRRHTEHVMAKLGVNRAAAIGPRLMATTRDDGAGEAE